MKHLLSLFILMFVCFVMIACIDEQKKNIPVIQDFSILSNEPLYALDTLYYTLDVVAETDLISANLYLKDDAGRILLTHSITMIESNQLLIDSGRFVLSRRELENGFYKLEVVVSNSDGVAKSEVNQTINALDPVVLQRFLIMHNNTYATTIVELDENGEITPKWIIQGDFLDAAIDCNDDLFFTIGKESGSLLCRDLEEDNVRWMFEAVHNPPFPYFQAFYKSHNRVWVALYQDNIFGFDHFGIEKFRGWLTNENFPESLIVSDEYMVVEEYAKSTMKKVLSSWYIASGVLHDSQETVFSDIILLGSKGNEIYYVGIVDGVSKFYAHNLTLNERRWLFDFDEVVNLACQGGDGCFLLATQANIYKYCPDYNLIHELDMGVEINSMTYEPLEEKLWIISGNTVFLYDLRSNILENSNTFEASPDKVVIRYNRNLFDIEL